MKNAKSAFGWVLFVFSSFNTFCKTEELVLPSSLSEHNPFQEGPIEPDILDRRVTIGPTFSSVFPYTENLKTTCPVTKDYLKPTGTIFSPSFPGNPLNDLDCYWTVVAPRDKMIFIEFSHFHLKDCLGCNCNFIALQESKLSTRGKKYCGNRNIGPFIWTGKSVTIRFYIGIGGFSFIPSFTLSWRHIASSCPNLVKKVHQKKSCKNGNKFLSTCTFRCLDGYKLLGKSLLKCSLPKKFPNGLVKVPTVLEHSSLIPYRSTPTSSGNIPNTTPIGPFTPISDGRILQPNNELGINMRNPLRRQKRLASSSSNDFIAWSSDQPDCRGFCHSIAITNGHTSCTNDENVNSVCAHSCTSGYTLVGSSSSRCIERSGSSPIWLPSIPRCQSLCSTISITNGKTSCSNDLNFDSVCSYSCSNGYRLVGSSTSTCIKQIGSAPIWSPSIPRCQGFCSVLKIANGQTSCTNGDNINSVCTHTCSSGYRLLGPSSSKCIEQRGSISWSTPLPQCLGFCPMINITKGQTSCSDHNNVNSSCTHSCSSGYRLVGSSSSRCTERRGSSPMWSPSIPTCDGFCYSFSIINGKTSCTNNVSLDSICSHSCSRGYRIVGSSSSTCIERSGFPPTWSTSIPKCQGYCSQISIPNGQTSCTNGVSLNSTCTHSCSRGYTLIGSSSSTCIEQTGSFPRWSTPIPICMGFCSTIFIANGQTSCTNTHYLDSICSHSCSKGYKLIGSSSSKCIEQSGSAPTWSTPIPSCQGVCSPFHIQNGRTSCSNGTNLNSVCRHSCSSGHRLIGSGTTTCLSTNRNSTQWSNPFPTCQAVCPRIKIPNGHTKCTRNEQIKSICWHSCSFGVPISNRYSRCVKPQGSDPYWWPPVPSCLDKLACPTLSITNGQVICTQGESVNSICRFTCSPGYIQFGASYARCVGRSRSNPRWIPPPLPCSEKSTSK